jgi:hypothetical protein
MKRDLLGLQIRNQLFSAISRDLIAYRRQYPAISFNCLVDLDVSCFARCVGECPEQVIELFGWSGCLPGREKVPRQWTITS